MLLYVLISFPFIWLAVATVVAAACRMAAQADHDIAQEHVPGNASVSVAGIAREERRAQTGVTGLRLAGQSRRLPAASA